MNDIAVIVPVYGVERYLRRCLDSLVAQTLRDFKVIIVEDGSPDGCAAICDEYAARDSRFTVIHQPNKGVSVARNVGLERALTDPEVAWIAFIDSDDWIDAEYLRQLLEGVGRGADVASVCCVLTDDDKEKARSGDGAWSLMSPRQFWLTAGIFPATVWGKLFRKSLFADVRFPSHPPVEDEWTIWKAVFAANMVAFCRDVRYFYYVRRDGANFSKWDVRRLSRIEAYLEQIEYFERQGFFELADHARKCIVCDYTDALRNLPRGDALARECREKLKAMLRGMNLDRKEFYLAYKAAYPLRMKLLKLFGHS